MPAPTPHPDLGQTDPAILRIYDGKDDKKLAKIVA